MAEGIIGGLIQLLFLGIALVIVTACVGVIVAKSSKSTTSRVVILVVVAAIIPIAYKMSAGFQDYRAQGKRDRHKVEADAFQKYCVIGRKHIIAQVASPVNASIEIEESTSPVFFWADSLAGRFASSKPYAGQICNKSGLRYLIGKDRVTRTILLRYPLCATRVAPEGRPSLAPFRAEAVVGFRAPYRLIFGLPFDVINIPVSGAHQFSKIQVQLVEVATKKVVSEDTLFFRGPTSQGDGVCPHADAQIHALLLGSFALDDPKPTFEGR